MQRINFVDASVRELRDALDAMVSAGHGELPVQLCGEGKVQALWRVVIVDGEMPFMCVEPKTA